MSKIKEKEKVKNKPPKIDEVPDDDALENYQGQWGISFVKRDGSHHIDIDEEHDTEEIALGRIDEAEKGLEYACLMVRTCNGTVSITQDEYAYGYPVPLGDNSE